MCGDVRVHNGHLSVYCLENIQKYLNYDANLKRAKERKE